MNAQKLPPGREKSITPPLTSASLRMKGHPSLCHRQQAKPTPVCPCEAVRVVALGATCKRKEEANGRQNQNGDHSHQGGRPFAGILAVRKRALFEWLEISQTS